ncbi:MAG: hypothetical protein WCE79_10045 [Xanthobacteraceae bacterium]
MKKLCLVLMLFVASGLMGCFSNEEGDFRKIIAADLSDQRFCTTFGIGKDSKGYWTYLDDSDRKRLAALENEKLANRVGGERSGLVPYTYVELTETLPPLSKKGFPFDGYFCFGKFELASVENWTKPASDASGRIITMVDYIYKLIDAPAWASSSTMRAAFPDLDKALSPGVKKTIKLVQTNKGWERSPY